MAEGYLSKHNEKACDEGARLPIKPMYLCKPVKSLPHVAKRIRVPKNKTKGRGGYVVGTFQPPGGNP